MYIVRCTVHTYLCVGGKPSKVSRLSSRFTAKRYCAIISAWRIATVYSFIYFAKYSFIFHTHISLLLSTLFAVSSSVTFVCSLTHGHVISYIYVFFRFSSSHIHSVFLWCSTVQSVRVEELSTWKKNPITFYIFAFYYISFRFPEHHLKLAIYGWYLIYSFIFKYHCNTSCDCIVDWRANQRKWRNDEMKQNEVNPKSATIMFRIVFQFQLNEW